jgi:D-alanyl-D-alanine carboxypeptidase (penicillin-binding protein 5/6)
MSSRRRSRRAVRLPAALPALAVAVLVAGSLLVASATPAHAAVTGPPRLAVAGACLIDGTTGQVLYAQGAERELAIASTTKLMTALVVLEHVRRLGTVFTQNGYTAAPGDSQIGLQPGERMSVHDLLLALMLPSADDAAEDLAYNVGRHSLGRFVAMMNAEARRLGLTHTHYATPSGLDTPGNYSSPCDLVTLARYDLQHSAFFRRIVGLRAATLLSGSHVRHIVNLDDLLRFPWIHGVKTGHTNDAGYVLVSAAARDGLPLISAVLGTSSDQARDANGLALLDWGYANFRVARLVRAGEVEARLPVKDRPGFRAAVIAGTGISAVVADDARIVRRRSLPRELAGPLARHAVVGYLKVLAGRRVLATVPLLLARRLPAVSSLTLAARFLTRASTLIVIFALLLLATVLVVVRRERVGPRARARWGGST